MDTKEKRMLWLDNLKALGIILVVLGHSNQQNTPILKYLDIFIYSFHMPFFFLLSGISFSIISCQNSKMRMQIGNIALIYIVQTEIYILINLIANRYIHTNTNVMPKDYLSCFLYPVAHFWYLYSILLIYLIEIILQRVIKNDNAILLMVLFLAIVGAFTEVKLLNLSYTLYELLFFEIGRQYNRFTKLPNIFSLFGIIIGICFPFINITDVNIRLILLILVALSVSISLLNVGFRLFNEPIVFLTKIGEKCIWIYIFHSYLLQYSE